MPEARQLAKATMVEIKLGNATTDTKPVGDPVAVQFNPESLKLSYSNTAANKEATDTAGLQYVTSSATKLDLELWFDASVVKEARDVRDLTAMVHKFVTPRAEDQSSDAKIMIPPVRFAWGSFLFDGLVTSLSETLDLFSHDGRPLRSSMSLSMTAQEIQFKIQSLDQQQGSGPGQQPTVPLPEAGSFQQMAAAAASAIPWQQLAAANDIDNPRMPEVGRAVSLSLRSAVR